MYETEELFEIKNGFTKKLDKLDFYARDLVNPMSICDKLKELFDYDIPLRLPNLQIKLVDAFYKNINSLIVDDRSAYMFLVCVVLNSQPKQLIEYINHLIDHNYGTEYAVGISLLLSTELTTKELKEAYNDLCDFFGIGIG